MHVVARPVPLVERQEPGFELEDYRLGEGDRRLRSTVARYYALVVHNRDAPDRFPDRQLSRCGPSGSQRSPAEGLSASAPASSVQPLEEVTLSVTWLPSASSGFASERILPNGYVRDDDTLQLPFDTPPAMVNFFYHEQVKRSAKAKRVVRAQGA